MNPYNKIEEANQLWLNDNLLPDVICGQGGFHFIWQSRQGKKIQNLSWIFDDVSDLITRNCEDLKSLAESEQVDCVLRWEVGANVQYSCCSIFVCRDSCQSMDLMIVYIGHVSRICNILRAESGLYPALGTSVASSLWLHWSPVLLYVYFSI